MIFNGSCEKLGVWKFLEVVLCFFFLLFEISKKTESK